MLTLCTGKATANAALVEVPIRRTRLKNGLRVVLSANLSSDRVAVCMTYGVGARNDPPKQKGLSALTARMSFDRSAELSGGRLFALAHEQGGDVTWNVNHERSQFCELLPVHALGLALWLEAQRVRPTSTKLDSQAASRVAREEYLAHITGTPYASGRVRLRRLLFGDSGAYSAPAWASLEALPGILEASVAEQLAGLYGPNNAVLSIVGRFEVIPTLRKVHDLFERLPKYPEAPPRLPDPRGANADASTSATVEDGNAGSMALINGWIVPFAGTRARHAINLASRILGEGVGSRLWQKLVANDEVAVWTRVSTSGERGPGVLRIETAMEETSEPEAAQRRVDEELSTLARQGPLARELVQAKRSAWLELLEAHEGELTLAKRLGDYELGWDDARKGWQQASGFMQLSAAEVQAAVSKYLTPERRRDVIVLPARTRLVNLGATLLGDQEQP